ncbi:MAG TPA: ATP-binding cassette domain-containing protein [Stellaceae bacterium]|nr:ATP-binding cassette domain-containing protein [Stellaceae bacterium]
MPLFDRDPAPQPVIRIRGLVTRFGTHTVHDGLDLDVMRGEIFGVIGGSGSGKSVLLRTIIGLNPPAGGSVKLFGSEVFDIPQAERHAIEQRLGVLFQDGALFSSMTVAENIEFALRESVPMPQRLMEEIAASKIALVGLSPDAGKKSPAQLSGGMRKRAALARALALDPELLILDEPTSGLDPNAADAFDRLIKDLQTGLGLTVFLVTHDLDTVFTVCDRVAVLVEGKAHVGTPDELLRDEHPWVRAYLRSPRVRAAQDAGQEQRRMWEHHKAG